MKKVVLSLAGVLAAVAFAPEASALPVFARQTGMACSACHFNHAPLLNGFGRAFKSAGYSMMGAQEKVEGENLSIPDRVNMAILTTTGYEKISGGDPALAGLPGGTMPGAWTVPSNGGELSLFMGGRIMDGSGFLAELGMGGAGAAVGAAKLLYMPEITSGTRLGVVFDTNNGQGVAHGFEILNTGAVNVHKMALGQTHINVYSAAQWMGTNNATTGVSIVALNDMGFINVTAYDAAAQAMGVGASRMPLTYARAAATFDAAGFDMAAGVQRWMGVSNGNQFAQPNIATPLVPGVTPGNYDATVIDFQAQGELAGMSTGIYASYGTAPINSMFGQGDAGVGAANLHKATTLNAGIDMNVGHEIIARAALRKATNGADNLADNAIMVGAIYELAQNFELHYTHTSQSGAHWNPVLGVTPFGKSTDSIVAEVLF